MPEITGTSVVRAIERLTAQELRESMSQRDLDLERLAERFFDRYEVPIQARRLSTFFRSIRKLDEEGLRYIRSLSETLLRLSDEELWREISGFQSMVEEIDSRAHQVKTQTSFISTVLRPFNNKYSYRWFIERQSELDVNRVKASIENLERSRIRSLDDLYEWGVAVEQLFFDVVVHKEEKVSGRSFGTVGMRSARTYLQAWTKLMKESANEILSAAEEAPITFESEQGFNQSVPETDYSDKRDKSLTDMVSFLSSSMVPTKPSRSEQRTSMMMAPPAFEYQTPITNSLIVSEQRAEKASGSDSFKVEISIESKIDSSARASKKWNTEEGFKESIENWLSTLPVLWGEAANQLVAKISIDNQTGESEITLPALTPSNSLERIKAAVQALSHS
jgi:hypothetical protein